VRRVSRAKKKVLISGITLRVRKTQPMQVF
jgi:hypothetical protein